MKIYLIIWFSIIHQLLFDGLRGQKEGDYLEEICFTIPQGNDIKEFYQKHPGLIKHKQISLGGETYHCAKFDPTQRTKGVDTTSEDQDVQHLRQSKDVLWVEQQQAHIRVKKTADTEWNNLWHLNDAVTPSMKVSEAWTDGYTGNGVIVAILDDGLQTDHPDLNDNVDTVNDIDIVDADDDPSPSSASDGHGTNVAGFIAAERDNNDCVVGVAYRSTILGVRILGDSALTDSQEAQALSHYISNVDIYSNSWGPTDGYGFDEPGTMTKAALQTGTTTGRGGKGVIFTWAAGNGETSDNCNGDGYTNSIYTIGITSVQSGKNAWYSEVCPAALAATYGGSSSDRYLITTKISSGCTSDSDGIQGTSFSTPIASGIIALALEANPNLTWRDVQHLIVLTSAKNDFSVTYSSWAKNGANKEFSQVLGFGLMNAEAMVTRAKVWTTVPTQQTCIGSTNTVSLSTSGSAKSQNTKTISSSDCPSVVYLEHVTATIEFSYSRYRGATELYLISPMGTESHLLHYRYTDANKFSYTGSLTWTFMSVHFWRENPVGTWTLKFKSYNGYSTVTLKSWFLTFYGTSTDPLTNIDQCTDTPCQNNGTCTNNVYSYSCQCEDGYIGTTCDDLITTTTTKTTTTTETDGTNTVVIVIVVIGGMAVVIMICIYWLIYKSTAKVGIAGETDGTNAVVIVIVVIGGMAVVIMICIYWLIYKSTAKVGIAGGFRGGKIVA